MKKVFVSGCFDILHGGHVEFLGQARNLGDYLIVCIPDDEAQFAHKHRRPFLPLEHKVALIQSLRMVDEVVVGRDRELGLNFKSAFLAARPDILVVTEDDQYEFVKRQLCEQVGARYEKLPKQLSFDPISSSELFQRAAAPVEAPLRVDLAGGWLDVPRFARRGGYIVNCTFKPLVSLYHWPFETGAGLGGSATYAYLRGLDCVKSELDNGVGWQDPAIVQETGLCVWHSGPMPVLEMKVNPWMLARRMALYWTGKTHVTKSLVDLPRDFDLLAHGSYLARSGVRDSDFGLLCEGVRITHKVQLKEGMAPLPKFGECACKYCGGGHGGYAVYLFDSLPAELGPLQAIEPYMKNFA